MHRNQSSSLPANVWLEWPFVAALALVIAIHGQACAQSVPWGWAPAGQAAAAWTPQNLADYLLTGQSPRPAVARIIAP